MNSQRWLLASIGAFVFVFVCGFIVHGVLLKGIYESTPHLWRSPEETSMFVMFLSQFLYASGLAFLFTRNYEGKGIGEGARFGLYVGLVLAAIELGKYAYMPVSCGLVAAWVLSALFINGMGAGIVISLIYKN